MGRALLIGRYLATAIMAISLIMLMVGLGMAARPEIFASLGFASTSRIGLALALGSGIGAIATAVLGRVLDLLRGTLSDQLE